jgi:hypothetical protein
MITWEGQYEKCSDISTLWPTSDAYTCCTVCSYLRGAAAMLMGRCAVE